MFHFAGLNSSPVIFNVETKKNTLRQFNNAVIITNEAKLDHVVFGYPGNNIFLSSIHSIVECNEE